MVFTLALLIFFASVKGIFAAPGINRKINFQGKVVSKGTGLEGLNVADGNYDFRFTLWDSLSAGTSLWTESWNSGTSQVPVGSGIFSVSLGTYVTFPDNLSFNSDSLYLSVEYNHDGDMTPRIRMSAVPYAFNAEKVNGLTVTSTSGTLSIGDSKTVTFGDNFMTVNGVGITLNQNLSTESLVSFAGLSVGGTVSFTNLPLGTGTTVLYITSTGNLRAGTLPSYTANNGLNLTGTVLGLGGTLTQATQIGTSNFSLLFTGLGGTQSLFIGASGYVGIGTTNPDSSLAVVGNIEASAWSIGTTGFACNDVNKGCKWNIRDKTISDWYVGYNNILDLSYDVALGSSNNDHYQFRVGKYVTGSFVAGMVVTNDGKIGIGTTLPTKKLDIAGDINLTGTIFVGAGVTGSSGQVLSSNGAGGLAWISAGGIGSTYSAYNGLSLSGLNQFGLGGTLAQNTTINTSNYSLLFLGLGNSQAFSISSNGRVGIGLTNPTTAKLEIVDMALSQYDDAVEISINDSAGDTYNSAIFNALTVDSAASSYGNMSGFYNVGTVSTGLKDLIGFNNELTSTSGVNNSSSEVIGLKNDITLQGAVNNNRGYGSHTTIRGTSDAYSQILVGSWDSLTTFSNDIAYHYYASVGSSSTAGTQYAFYGDMSSGTATKWGAYLVGEIKNYFSGSVGIGTTDPTHELDVIGDGMFSTNLGVGGSLSLSGISAATGAGILYIDSGGNIISGTAPATATGTNKKIVLSPEYPGASLTTDGSGTTAVSITSDSTLNAGGIGWKNYYELSSEESSVQDYTVIVRVTLPSDFESWSSGSCPGSQCAITIYYQTGTSLTANNYVSIRVNNDSDTPGTTVVTTAASANTSWSQATYTKAAVDDDSAPDWDAADETAVFRIKLASDNSVGALARVGDIVLNYVAKY